MLQSTQLVSRGKRVNSQMLRRVVNHNSGTTANGSCKPSTTWLKTNSRPTPAVPKDGGNERAAGTIARQRVSSRSLCAGHANVEKALHHDLSRQGAGNWRSSVRKR